VPTPSAYRPSRHRLAVGNCSEVKDGRERRVGARPPERAQDAGHARAPAAYVGTPQVGAAEAKVGNLTVANKLLETKVERLEIRQVLQASPFIWRKISGLEEIKNLVVHADARHT
jgi:hypothetical protein